MEALLSYGYEFPGGPVHLNVSNNIIDTPIEFGVKKDWSNEPQQAFQKSLQVRARVIQPNVVFSRQLCDMHIDNDAKKRNIIRYPKLLDIR